MTINKYFYEKIATENSVGILSFMEMRILFMHQRRYDLSMISQISLLIIITPVISLFPIVIRQSKAIVSCRTQRLRNIFTRSYFLYFNAWLCSCGSCKIHRTVKRKFTYAVNTSKFFLNYVCIKYRRLHVFQ